MANSRNTTRKTTNSKKSSTGKRSSGSSSGAARKKTASTGSARKRTSSASKSRSTGRGSSSARRESSVKPALRIEIKLIILAAIAVLFELSAFGACGSLGYYLGFFLFGMTGALAYIFPALVFLAVLYLVLNLSNRKAVINVIFGCLLYYFLCALIQLAVRMDDGVTVGSIYLSCGELKNGGGLIPGLAAYGLYNGLGKIGAVVISIAVMVVSVIVITGQSLFSGVKKSSRYIYDRASEEAKYLKESSELRRERKAVAALHDETELKRAGRKARGVLINPVVSEGELTNDEMTEIKPEDIDGFTSEIKIHNTFKQEHDIFEEEIINAGHQQAFKDIEEPEEEISTTQEEYTEEPYIEDTAASQDVEDVDAMSKPVTKQRTSKNYKLPPKSILAKAGRGSGRSSGREQAETAQLLVQTLANFGIKVGVSGVSVGPSVTRYELSLEMGTSVKKITALTDDIKLALAATEIRIEAPIPGKSAVGIEVPNQERNSVLLSELLDSPELKNHGSKIAFAAGKDISGNIVVADIAKMPHLLVAGTTGSGKSVFMNSIIMTLLYRAKPDEVKLIIVDPKKVEFGIYNGIPHLENPVITDPMNAAAALNWATGEMDRRYQMLADYNVRDFKSFNQKVEELRATAENPEGIPEKMPQIVIVIDELADHMMVAKKSVETSICRLAQLARAAGMHLIVATQKPTVDVVTGLIKSNIPSRAALLVANQTDSRVIVDTNGAESLLGNGDMLLSLSGAKPVRVQGAFVSDEEVIKTVEYIKNQVGETTYNDEIARQIQAGTSSDAEPKEIEGAEGSSVDSVFIEAGRLIIEMDKASSSMLQRRFRIGFNRAARIIDELYELGVVGPDEGSKPRKVLMTSAEFEELITKMQQ